MHVSFNIAKYCFRIRTSRGFEVGKIMIHGRDQAEAEKKLRQVYPRCEIIEHQFLSAQNIPIR